MLIDKRAQSLIQYALLFALLTAALLAMRPYLTRSVQGRFRQGIDAYGQGEQYETGVTRVSENSNFRDIIPDTPDRDTCPNLRVRIENAQRQVDSFIGFERENLTRAQELRDYALTLRPEQAVMIIRTVEELERRANDLRIKIDALNGNIARLSDLYAQKGCSPPLP